MSQTVQTPLGVPLPQLEIVLAGAAWVAATAGLGAGGGTLLMAAGLLATGWAVVQVRRNGLGARLDRDLKRRVVRVGIVVLAVLVVLTIVLPMIPGGWGELTVPIGCAIVGGGLFPLSAALGERSFVALGGLLVVLGAIGAVVALGSAGITAPLAVVGFPAAALLSLAAVRRLGLVGEFRRRTGR